MPLFGTLDISRVLPHVPTVDDFAPETLVLPGASILQVSYEVDEASALAITPPALHPSIPPYATFSFMDFPESPIGPFTMATVRLIVRAGIRPRALLVGGWTNSAAAVERLGRGWGYRLGVADVQLNRRHNRIAGTVTLDGAEALVAALDDPEPVIPSDIELFDNLHLAKVVGGPPVIVQVDPGYTYINADRGGANLSTFRPEALKIEGIEPVYPVVGVACQADVVLTAPRFVLDPELPAFKGTRRLPST